MPNAVVTGAASGIGRLTVERLLEAGWSVAAVDLPSPSLDELGAHPAVTVHPCDVRDLAQVRASAADVLAHYQQVDRLVTAAGIAVIGPIGEVPLERVSDAIAVNYLGTVAWVTALLPNLRAGSGEVVMYASLAGWIVTPGYGAYTASKFAVVGFAETLAVESRGTGLTVRCVCPPAVRTPMLAGVVRDGQSPAAVERSRPLLPENVVAAVERSLKRRRRQIWVFPGPAGLVWRLRRLTPRLVNAAATRLSS